MSAEIEFKLPQAREGLSLDPAKALLTNFSRTMPILASSALLGGDFQNAAISQAIGEIQDALEAYAKRDREQP